ncbi:MAG: PKD domain-containing protein, partial [Bacteroidota bacterium]
KNNTMKIYYKIFLVTMIALLMAIGVNAQKEATIKKLPPDASVTIDGVEDEDFWSTAEEFTGLTYNNASPDDEYDHKLHYWKAVWNDTAIFFLAKVEDDLIYPNDHWASDQVELYFRFGGKEILQYYILSYQDSGVYQVPCRTTAAGVAKKGLYKSDTSNYYCQTTDVKTATHWGYTMEAYVKWDYFVEYSDTAEGDTIPVVPEDGYTFDFDANFQDNDTDPEDPNYPNYEELARGYWSSDTNLFENDWSTVGTIILEQDTPYLENPGYTISSKEVCPDENISFLAEPAGVNYSWNFGDGVTSSMMDPDHSYDTAGMYPVSLYMSDNVGNDTTFYDTIKVAKNKIISNGRLNIYDHNPFYGVNITFSAEPDNVSYAWDLGDGSSSTQQLLNHSYANEGTYQISLTLTNNYGNDTTLFDSVIVEGANLSSDTAVIMKINPNETVTIDGVGDESFWTNAVENTAVNYQNASPSDEYDFKRYWWKAAWNDTAIFFLVKVEDDHVYPYDYWASDGVELYFRFGGKEILENIIFSYQDSGVYLVACKLTEKGVAEAGVYPHDTTKYKVQSVEVQTGTHWGYFLEAYVLWDYFVEYVNVDSVKDVVPEPGYTFDFDINTQDNDTDPDDSQYPNYEELVRAYWSSDTHLFSNDWSTVGTIMLKDDHFTPVKKTQESPGYNIYPNPARNYLYVRGKIDYIHLYDMMGRMVINNKHKHKHKHNNKIHISHLNPGLYVVKLYHNNSLAGTERIIITE